MTRFHRTLFTVILLACIFSIGIVCAADAEETQADLNVSKVVSSAGPYETNDEITWIVTVWNNGPGNATNITLAENSSHLSGLTTITAVAGRGEYNTTTNLWNISELGNATSATLTLTTTFSTSGEKINRVDITALSETDPVAGDNHAEAAVQVNASDVVPPVIPITADLRIRPNTLNLKSKGVFTVFITLKGITGEFVTGEKLKSRIDSANSSLTCGGAEMVRMSASNKDGGTLIAKFHRQDLENVTAGDGVQINCSGTLTVDGKAIDVEGSDTIRVIGEKSEVDKIFSRLLKFLGLSKDDVEIIEDEDGNVTLTVSLNPDDFRKSGQIKKAFTAPGKKSDSQAGDDPEVSRTTPGKENQEREEKTPKTNGNDNSIRENNAGKKEDTGNNENNGRDDTSNGKPNGKKNK